MTSDKARSQWIAEALERTGKTQRGLARALNIEPPQANRLVKGLRRLRAAELPLVERYLGERAPDAVEHEIEAGAPDGFVTVPVFDLRASAGAGSVAVDGEPIDHKMFAESELRHFTKDFSQLFVLEIEGDSGLPTLHSGDHALCDRSQVNPRREGLYVIRIDDVLQVKRLSMHPVTRLLTVKSDNPEYPTYPDINPDDIAIVARVVWIGRRLV